MLDSVTTPSTVLAIGAHPDDIELGAGGLLLKLHDAGWKIVFMVATDGSKGGTTSLRRHEQGQAAGLLCAEVLWGDFEDGHVQAIPETVKWIEKAVYHFKPQVVLTHWKDDTHQDHRNLALATFSACRCVDILISYEGPSTDCFEPFIFESMDDAYVERKNELMRCHASQLGHAGRPDFLAWMNNTGHFRANKVRGSFCEAFRPIHVTFLSHLRPPMDHVLGIRLPKSIESPSTATSEGNDKPRRIGLIDPGHQHYEDVDPDHYFVHIHGWGPGLGAKLWSGEYRQIYGFVHPLIDNSDRVIYEAIEVDGKFDATSIQWSRAKLKVKEVATGKLQDIEVEQYPFTLCEGDKLVLSLGIVEFSRDTRAASDSDLKQVDRGLNRIGGGAPMEKRPWWRFWK